MSRRSWLRWGLLGLALVLAAAAALLTSVRGAESVTATSVVIGLPRQGAVVGSDILELAATRYVAYLSSDATQQEIANREGLPADVVSDVTVSQAPGTINISIRARAPQPGQAAAVANALASAAVAYSAGDPLVRVEVVAPAVVGRPSPT